MEAYGTKGTLVGSSEGLPQIAPVSLSGARGEDPLLPLDVPDSAQMGLTVPPGPGHNIARSYARMAHAIRTGTAAGPDFGHAVELHQLLDLVQKSAAARQTMEI